MSTTTFRKDTILGQNAGRVMTYDAQSPAYAATLAVTTNAGDTIIKVGTLTGNLSVTGGTGSSGNPPFIGDTMRFLFHADGTDRTVSFSTGFAGSTSVVVSASSYAYSEYRFNGTNWVISTSSSYQGPATDVQTPAYGASIAITTTVRNTAVVPAQLTGALTITAVTTSAQSGDTLNFIFSADSTARVVTFSTNFTASGTLTVRASSTATASFIYNGSSWILVSVNDLRSKPDVQAPAYGATISLTTTKATTFVNVGQLAGALTINAVVTSAIANDLLYFTFSADGTNRVVTFGTNIKSSGTLTVTASKFGSSAFIYDGTEWLQLSATATA